MEVLEMLRNYVFVCALIVLAVVVNDCVAFSADQSINVTGQKKTVAVRRKDDAELKAMRGRGLAYAQDASRIADEHNQLVNDLKLTENELNALTQDKKVAEQIIKKLKVARFRVQCREKANPSTDSEVYRRRLQNLVFQIDNQNEDLEEINERMLVLNERLDELNINYGLHGARRGNDEDDNLDKEFEAEIRERWNIGSNNIDLSILIDYP
jgi:hypothetical protein